MVSCCLYSALKPYSKMRYFSGSSCASALNLHTNIIKNYKVHSDALNNMIIIPREISGVVLTIEFVCSNFFFVSTIEMFT